MLLAFGQAQFSDIAFRVCFAIPQEMRFDVRLLQRVPAEGVSRMRECLHPMPH